MRYVMIVGANSVSVYRCDRIVSGRVPTSYRIVTLIWIVKWV